MNVLCALNKVLLRTLDVFASVLKGHCILTSQKVHVLISLTLFCTYLFPMISNSILGYLWIFIPGGIWWCLGQAGPPQRLGRCTLSMTQRWRWSGDSSSSLFCPQPPASPCSADTASPCSAASPAPSGPGCSAWNRNQFVRIWKSWDPVTSFKFPLLLAWLFNLTVQAYTWAKKKGMDTSHLPNLTFLHILSWFSDTQDDPCIADNNDEQGNQDGHTKHENIKVVNYSRS